MPPPSPSSPRAAMRVAGASPPSWWSCSASRPCAPVQGPTPAFYRQCSADKKPQQHSSTALGFAYHDNRHLLLHTLLNSEPRHRSPVPEGVRVFIALPWIGPSQTSGFCNLHVNCRPAWQCF
ncbi:hypothetical protein LZ32DRAFT_598641 [Colletotrichum eremochloae]|nr:hypothetical protein LZ32DRAFT_598641 [Colletotrichum eremochloae]